MTRTTIQERRTAPRVGARLPLQLTESESRQVVTTESVDLSRNGIACRTADFVAPLSRVALTIILPPFGTLSRSPRSLRAEGVVVRCEPVPGPVPGTESQPPEYEMACCFTALESDARNLLDAFVAWRLLRSVRADEERSAHLRTGATRASGPRHAASHARGGSFRTRPGGRGGRPAPGTGSSRPGGRPRGDRPPPGGRPPGGRPEGRRPHGTGAPARGPSDARGGPGRRGSRPPHGASSSRPHSGPVGERPRERPRPPRGGTGRHGTSPRGTAPSGHRDDPEHFADGSPQGGTSPSAPSKDDANEKRWGRRPLRSSHTPRDRDSSGGPGNRS